MSPESRSWSYLWYIESIKLCRITQIRNTLRSEQPRGAYPRSYHGNGKRGHAAPYEQQTAPNERQKVAPNEHHQRWAPSAYNLRPLGVSLGISGHRTDLVQEISEPDRDRAQAERELTYAGSRMGTGDWQTVRVGLGVSNTRPIPSGYRAGIGFGM